MKSGITVDCVAQRLLLRAVCTEERQIGWIASLLEGIAHPQDGHCHAVILCPKATKACTKSLFRSPIPTVSKKRYTIGWWSLVSVARYFKEVLLCLAQVEPEQVNWSTPLFIRSYRSASDHFWTGCQKQPNLQLSEQKVSGINSLGRRLSMVPQVNRGDSTIPQQYGVYNAHSGILVSATC